MQNDPKIIWGNVEYFANFLAAQAIDFSERERYSHLWRQTFETAIEDVPRLARFQEADGINRPTNRRLIFAPMTAPRPFRLEPVKIVSFFIRQMKLRSSGEPPKIINDL